MVRLNKNFFFNLKNHQGIGIFDSNCVTFLLHTRKTRENASLKNTKLKLSLYFDPWFMSWMLVIFIFSNALWAKVWYLFKNFWRLFKLLQNGFFHGSGRLDGHGLRNFGCLFTLYQLKCSQSLHWISINCMDNFWLFEILLITS